MDTLALGYVIPAIRAYSGLAPVRQCSCRAYYDNAISRIDAMIANPAVDQQKLISRLKFIARLGYYRSEDIPRKWFDKCVEYLRYIAYNQTDRDDAFIHQEYAVVLEKMLAQVAKDGGKVPSFIISEPTQGKKEYSMRPAALKQKPRRK